MLTFTDRPRAINVFRTEQSDAGAKKVRLGAIHKSRMEINDELRQKLNNSELSEVGHVIDLYKAGSAAQEHLDLLRFPEIVKNVLAFVASADGDEVLKKVLAGCLAEGYFQLRRQERRQVNGG